MQEILHPSPCYFSLMRRAVFIDHLEGIDRQADVLAPVLAVGREKPQSQRIFGRSQLNVVDFGRDALFHQRKHLAGGPGVRGKICLLFLAVHQQLLPFQRLTGF